MHTEFSWIVLWIFRLGSARRRVFSPRKRQEVRENGKGLWERERLYASSVPKIRSKARDIAKNLQRKRESNRWIFISIHRAIYHSKNSDGGGWCVRFSLSYAAILRAFIRETAAPLVTCHEFRPRKRGSFRPGQNVFCTFVTARVTFARPSTLYRHLHVVSFSPLNSRPRHATSRHTARKLRRFGDRVPQFIFHAWVRRLGASNTIAAESRKRDTQRDSVSNCT